MSGLEYKSNDTELTAADFLSLAQRVWPGDYDLGATETALTRTTNIAARDGARLVGVVRVLSDGYFFGTIPELLVDPDYQGKGVGTRLMELAWEISPTSLFFGAQPESEAFYEGLGYEKGPQSYLSTQTEVLAVHDKTQKFDEEKWPELTAFRDACLADNHSEMSRIAERKHHWYENENPDELPMEKLASIYKAQWYAITGDLKSLRRVVTENPWTANARWTAQGWLPISQAASTHGKRDVIEFLLQNGADPTLSVGSPDDRATIVEMARYGNHVELADWLEQQIADADDRTP